MPDTRRLSEIARVLGVDVPTLMDWTTNTVPVPNPEIDGEFVHDLQEILLIDIWRTLDAPLRLAMMNTAVALRDAKLGRGGTKIRQEKHVPHMRPR